MNTKEFIIAGIIFTLIVSLSAVAVIIAYSAYYTIENGIVKSITSYNGAGQIGGFSSGSTGQLMFYKLTISFKGETYHTTVACSLYSIGSEFPMRVGLNWANPQSSFYLPVGCYTGK